MDQLSIRESIANGAARFPGSKQKKRNGSMKKVRNNEEEQLQCACHSWNKLCEKQYPLLEWIFHCPNGGGRSKSESGILKAMGVKPGIPDFMLPFQSGAYIGLGIELKSSEGRLSDDQRKWLQYAHSQGWCVAVVRTLDQYIDVVRLFMKGSKHKILYGEEEIFKVKK